MSGESAEIASLPGSSSNARRNDLFWKYQLPQGNHTVTFKWLNPADNASVNCIDAIVYSDVLGEKKN